MKRGTPQQRKRAAKNSRKMYARKYASLFYAALQNPREPIQAKWRRWAKNNPTAEQVAEYRRLLFTKKQPNA